MHIEKIRLKLDLYTIIKNITPFIKKDAFLVDSNLTLLKCL